MRTRAKMSSSDAKTPKPAANSHIASALRTLDTEAEGVAALAAAMSDGLGAPFVAAVETIRGGARPGHRHRHGQVRSRGAQDRRHARFDRHAGLLRARRRRQPRRSRHDHLGRRDAGAVLVGRDRRAQRPDQLLAPLPHRADRDHGERRKYARQGRRHRTGAAGGARSLSAQSGADHLVADAACARRRAGDRAVGKPRLHRNRFRRVSSARQAWRGVEIRRAR